MCKAFVSCVRQKSASRDEGSMEQYREKTFVNGGGDLDLFVTYFTHWRAKSLLSSSLFTLGPVVYILLY